MDFGGLRVHHKLFRPSFSLFDLHLALNDKTDPHIASFFPNALNSRLTLNKHGASEVENEPNISVFVDLESALLRVGQVLMDERVGQTGVDVQVFVLFEFI